MTLDIQAKIKNNQYYLKYLREHSKWYKILNRNPSMFKYFEEQLKEEYKIRPIDKITKTLDTIELMQNLLTSLK